MPLKIRTLALYPDGEIDVETHASEDVAHSYAMARIAFHCADAVRILRCAEGHFLGVHVETLYRTRTDA
jgi:hypothetical protein